MTRAAALVPATVFVLLWSSGAIICEIALRHASPLAVLLARYGLAWLILVIVAAGRGKLLPEPGTRLRNVLIGVLFAGFYSAFYLLALENGVTPGLLATVLGVQPILTVLLTERRASPLRLAGLACAMAGLALVVAQGLRLPGGGVAGYLFAGLSLLGITLGSILQKREGQPPWEVLPLQYTAGLAVVLVLVPFAPLQAELVPGFILPALWLGLVISIGTTFLLYGLIARGNLVNVTSLLYLVPGVTAVMDWAWLSHPMPLPAIIGMALIVGGLVLVFRQPAAQPVTIARADA